MNALTESNPQPVPVLQCEKIVKRYDDELVLDGIRLSIAPGSIVGLVARNGAGKTTLIRMVLGLLQPEAGAAFVLGDPALALTDASKRQLGYVPQKSDALGWMRVGEMLEFVGGLYPLWDRDYVQQSLLRWNIAPARRLTALSPGERQRVALIRALAIRPRRLVLDEPAAMLDPVARRDLLRELAVRAADATTTVLFSTHVVSDLERVASHVMFLHRRRLMIQSAMDDLKDNHALLRLNADSAAGVPARLSGELSRRRQPDGRMSLLLARTADSDWPPVAYRPGAQLQVLDLEDLFIELAA